LKIGIVALNYAPATIGGAESYYVDLIKYLQVVDSKNEYVLFMRNPYRDLLPVANNFSVKLVTHSRLSLLISKFLKKVMKIDIQQMVINNQHCDILHFPFQVVNFSSLRPKVISTAIDIQEEYYPENFSPEDLASRKRLHKISVERSDYLISISDFTRDTYIKKYGLSKSKISTVHLSYNEALYSTRSKKSTLDLPKQYFYYPAATWPHKNHSRLIRSFAVFFKKHPDYSLVLSGIKKHNSDDLKALIDELGVDDSVIILGYVSRDSLPELYRRSVAMVFPSLFEGFGIPVLEAMACGTPVICSNTSSLPEVGGNAAMYFDPTKSQAIADAMERVAGDEQLREKMKKAGLKQANIFSARKTAAGTLAVYDKVGETHE